MEEIIKFFDKKYLVLYNDLKGINRKIRELQNWKFKEFKSLFEKEMDSKNGKFIIMTAKRKKLIEKQNTFNIVCAKGVAYLERKDYKNFDKFRNYKIRKSPKDRKIIFNMEKIKNKKFRIFLQQKKKKFLNCRDYFWKGLSYTQESDESYRTENWSSLIALNNMNTVTNNLVGEKIEKKEIKKKKEIHEEKEIHEKKEIHKEKIDKTVVSDHLNKIFKFLYENKLQVKLEHISESLFSLFGMDASSFFNIKNVNSRIVNLRKKIRKVHKDKFPESDILNRYTKDESFHKFNVGESKIYYNSKKIKYFFKQNKTIFFVDGTRKLVSVGIDRRQLLTISSKVHGRGFTLVYILGPSQTTKHYIKCFKEIKKMTGIFSNCEFAITDMELALSSSLCSIGVESRFCYFHVASRMIKWKSRNDKESNNSNYIRPELISMAQNIIFIHDVSLKFFFTILIWIFVQEEKDEFRKKNAGKFISYCFNFYVKKLGSRRYHKITGNDITNNIIESFHGKLKKRLCFKKPLQFIIDACFIHDFEEMSMEKKKNKTNLNKFCLKVINYQKRQQTFGATYGFLITILKNKLKKKKKKKNYNLKKMIKTFTECELDTLLEKRKSFVRNNFGENKMTELNIQSFFETGDIKLLKKKNNDGIIETEDENKNKDGDEEYDEDDNDLSDMQLLSYMSEIFEDDEEN